MKTSFSCTFVSHDEVPNALVMRQVSVDANGLEHGSCTRAEQQLQHHCGAKKKKELELKKINTSILSSLGLPALRFAIWS